MKRTLLFKILDVFLILLMAYKVWQILFRIYAIVTVTRVLQGNELIRPQLSYIGQGMRWENKVDIVSILTLLILLSTWFYIKYRSAHRATHLQLTYKPIWAVFSFVIPVFNLVAPYKIMSDLWIVQNKDMSAERTGKLAIKTWWILSIIVFVVSRLLRSLSEKAEGLQGFLQFEYYYLLYFAFVLHYILLTRKLVKMMGP